MNVSDGVIFVALCQGGGAPLYPGQTGSHLNIDIFALAQSVCTFGCFRDIDDQLDCANMEMLLPLNQHLQVFIGHL